jgi:hypothetical protein
MSMCFPLFFLLSAVSVNESCIFNEQCEDATPETACMDGKCICRFDKTPITKKDNSVECVGELDDHEKLLATTDQLLSLLSCQGEGSFTAIAGQPSNVPDPHRHGFDVHYNLRCSTPVQQVSTRKPFPMQMYDEKPAALIINENE